MNLKCEQVEMSPEFTDTARAALLWVLWHHQGGSSPVGQPIRFALGMGAHDALSKHQVQEAKRWAALAKSESRDFHRRFATAADIEKLRIERDALAAKLKAMEGQEPVGYQALFNAIAAATCIQPGGIGVSVEAFTHSIGPLFARPVPAEPARLTEALSKRCYTLSEGHLSGYRVVLGFETLDEAHCAHEEISKAHAIFAAETEKINPRPAGD